MCNFCAFSESKYPQDLLCVFVLVLFMVLVLVLVLVFDLVLVLDMLNLKIFSQSDGSLSSSSETLLRVVEEASKVGEFKLIRIEKFHLEKKHTA